MSTFTKELALEKFYPTVCSERHSKTDFSPSTLLEQEETLSGTSRTF